MPKNIVDRRSELCASGAKSRKPLAARRSLIELNGAAERENCERLQLIGCLTAGVAHDMNNLLTAIIGNSQMALRRLGGDDKLADNIREIESAGIHAAELAAQLLKLSRGEQVRFEVLGLNATVTEISNLLRRVIGKRIDLEFDPGKNLDYVYASSTNVEQILLNLCINARDAMNAGGTIKIWTENSEIRNKRYVMIGVRDTGKGIEVRPMSRIFEAFYTTKSSCGGTGLGLSNVQRIVKSHGGLIKVQSKPGQGTVFRVYLPAIYDN